MKLSHYHRAQGDEIHFTRNVGRGIFEPDYDLVYGSAIFTRSYPLVRLLQKNFPRVVVGGTGSYETYRDFTPETYLTVEKHLGTMSTYNALDYSLYPDFDASLGFTQRGCRFKCGWCMVPATEGAARATGTIGEVWRGAPYPKHIHLLDNDFFGQDETQWKSRVDEVIDGGYRVCLNQGVNIRVIDERIAAEIARLPYYDDSFKTKTLYTAWDSLGDRKRFERGVAALQAAGVPPGHLLVYMLIGFDPRETWAHIFERFNIMLALGVRPYPMVYNNARPELKMFQRYVIRHYYEIIAWPDYVAQEGHSQALHELAKAHDARSDTVERRRSRRAVLSAERRQPELFDGCA